MRAQLLADFRPRIKVVSRGNRAADALRLAHAPELLERLRAVDRRLVVPRRLVDVVGPAVGCDGALFGGA